MTSEEEQIRSLKSDLHNMRVTLRGMDQAQEFMLARIENMGFLIKSYRKQCADDDKTIEFQAKRIAELERELAGRAEQVAGLQSLYEQNFRLLEDAQEENARKTRQLIEWANIIINGKE